MSSSEKAKTPASFEERNPFDISRNSGPEVAAEIAKRMAAWKTARARTYAAPTTIPGPDAKQAPIAAPVQPARVPKAAAQPAAPARGAGATPRVPYFASASATRRAMPPAPSLKQPSSGQTVTAPTEPVTPTAPAISEQASPPEPAPPIDGSPALDPAPAEAAPIAAEAPSAGSLPSEDSPFAAAAADAPAIGAAHPEVGDDEEKDRIRAEARAIQARWIAAHDLDSIAEAEANAGAAPAADVESVVDHDDAPEDESRAAVNAAVAEEQAAQVEPEHNAIFDADAVRRDPTFEATATPESVAQVSEETPDLQVASEPERRADRVADISAAMLDEFAGRKKPTFDPPEVAARDEPFEELRASQAAPEPDAADISIAALDEMAGRKEPTFDGPAPKEKQAAAELPRLETAPLDHAARLSEPTPAAEPKPAAPIVVPRIKMRPIETRIEARRIETLRAEPELSAGRPLVSHDEAEDWDMPPTLAAKAERARRGTGWAIGLGSVLLIAGITAPAAIWQQGRQDQDRVALVTPAPAPAEVSSASTAALAPTSAPATLAAAPQAAVAPAPATEPAAEDFATVLKQIGDGVEVEPAPVMTPPPPAETLANASPAAGGPFMVARPFVPESGDGPFLRAPAGMTPIAPAGAKPGLTVQLKPKVAAVAAKPAVGKPKPVARQPKPFFQQSPDQMFNTLIETLSEGKPVNPATKPQSPSTRR
jgi:hypothetical protein